MAALAERVYRTEKQKLALATAFLKLRKRGARGKFLAEKGIPTASMYAWVKKYSKQLV